MTADAAGAGGGGVAGTGAVFDLSALGARPLGPADPATVGRYRIHALLGIGGMGRVYLGWAQPPGFGGGRGGVWVAVKVIRPDLADDPEFRRRFARELEAVGRVRTPFAAALVHGEPEAPQPWMATEFVPGVSLADAVPPGGGLPATSLWRLAHDLGSALTAVHQAGLVHRDVKPSNVILGSAGAKVIDFGVAHASDLSQLTATGMNIGTPGYMAPEQAKAGEVSPASDVFSLGVLLYFAATGRLPFGEGGTAEVLFRVVYEEPDVSALDAVEPGVRALILRCLAKDPLHRPNAAGVLAAAQDAAAAGVWAAEQVAVWPEALAARISERTLAAGRTLPDPSTAGPVAPPEPVAPAYQAFEPVMPPPLLPANDAMPTVYTGTVDGAARPGADSKRRGVLVAGISAVVVLGLGVAALEVWGPGSGTGATAASGPTTSSGGGSSVAQPGAGVTASGVSAGAVPSRSASASASTSVSAATAGAGASSSAVPGASSTTDAGGVVTSSAPGQQTSAAQTNAAPTTATTTTTPAGSPNKYTATQACGSGFGVVDHHALTGATVYLLYDNSTGYNCVVTMATSVSGAVTMNATLTVQGGSSASDPGNWTYYAGPVTEHAPASCVEWGGSYRSSSWTSGWSHCG